MISPGRSWEVPVRSWVVLGVHVTSCEYMRSPGRLWEIFGGPGGSWGSLDVLGGPGKSWEVIGGHLNI